MQLARPANNELDTLLKKCNQVAAEFSQPLLYSTESQTVHEAGPSVDRFHVSLGWSLAQMHDPVVTQLTQRLDAIDMSFDNVKVRIGQDVTTIPLAQPRDHLSKKTLFS